MELLDNLMLGLATAATMQNLIYCFVGVFLGTFIGVLPGDETNFVFIGIAAAVVGSLIGAMYTLKRRCTRVLES